MRILYPIIILILFLFFNLFAQDRSEDYELIEINIEGNDYFSDGMIKSILISKETPMWFWKFLNRISKLGKEPTYFDSSNINKDLKIIQAFYRDNGFFSASVSGSYKLDTLNKQATITYYVSENKRSIINSYEYPDLNKVFDRQFFTEFFYDKFQLKLGKYFSQDNLLRDITFTVNELRNYGFMLAEKQDAVIEVDTLNNVVDIIVNIKVGKNYTIDTILIQKKGQEVDVVADELIYHIVDIKKGDRYNLSEINKAQLRLYRTELFTSALINTIIVDSITQQVPLKVSLDIGKINEISPEIIINNQSSTFNLGFGASYIRKNFLGGARKLSMTGTVISQDIFRINFKRVFGGKGFNDTTIIGNARLSFGIEQPYFIENYITADLQFYANLEQQKIYNLYSVGTKLGFKFDLPQFTFFNGLNTFIGFESEKIYLRKDLFREYLIAYLKSTGSFYNEKEVNEFIESFSANQVGQSNILLGVDLLSSHTNDLFFPTLGYNLQINLENAGLLPLIKNLFKAGSDQNVQYYKLNAIVTTYTNPWKPSIGAVAYKLRVGYMQRYDGKRNIPISKLFYIGGSNSIRGWAARTLGPNVTATDSLGNPIDIVQNGGKFLLEGSIETRNRLIGDLGTAVFFDFGNSWESYKDFSFNSCAIAFGVGLRYYTSFAPFRIDFGFKLYDPYKKEFNLNKKFFDGIEINLGIGEAF